MDMQLYDYQGWNRMKLSKGVDHLISLALVFRRKRYDSICMH